VLTIRKEWKKHHLDRISKSRVKKRDLLVCVLDREHCDVALLKESGIEMKAGIENHDKENMNDYYKEIEGFIENQKYEKIIVAGPGFERENFLRYLKTKRSGLEKDVILEHASSVGINGVQEVIKKSANRILRESRISRETEIIQELMTRISREGLAVYGKKEVENAMELGALERLFVSDRKVRDYEGLMERFEKMKGEVVIIGSDHESGEQFLHLGGIAGFLRFKTAY
jgi:protein pelota